MRTLCRLSVQGLASAAAIWSIYTPSKPFSNSFATIDATLSCHSVAEAVRAQTLGCTYVTAGHIFETDCKLGLPGRGLKFLTEVCQAVSIPVCAIGGISAENLAAVRDAGAAGACVMSGPMTCEDPVDYFAALRRVL